MSLKTRFYKYSEMFMDWGNCIQTRYVVVQNIYATYLFLSLCLLHLGFCVQNILLSSNFNKYSCLPYFFRMYHDLGSVWTWPLMRLSKKWFENGGWDTDERVGFNMLDVRISSIFFSCISFCCTVYYIWRVIFIPVVMIYSLYVLFH